MKNARIVRFRHSLRSISIGLLALLVFFKIITLCVENNAHNRNITRHQEMMTYERHKNLILVVLKALLYEKE